MHTSTLGERLRERRKAHSLTKQAVAESIGVDRSTVYRWETDRVRPRRADLHRVARLLEVEPEWLESGAASEPAA